MSKYQTVSITGKQSLPGRVVVETSITDDTGRMSAIETGSSFSDNVKRDYNKLVIKAELNAIYRYVSRGRSGMKLPLSPQDYNIIMKRYESDIIGVRIEYLLKNNRRVERKSIKGKEYLIVSDSKTGKEISRVEA